MIIGAHRPALFSEADLVVDLARRLDGKRGAQGRLADDLGVSQPALSNVLTGGRSIGPDFAERLGFRRVIMFEPISD